MKIGILFLTTSILLLFHAFIHPNSWFLPIWPSIGFGLAGFAYLTNKSQIFGKNDNGKLKFISVFLLLPYLLCLWIVWHLLRLIKSEDPFNQIDENIFIGRRLSKSELPDHIGTVIDLTCEFFEPRQIVANCEYLNFQILDASAPDPEKLAEFVTSLSMIDHNIYIHCAEGHGRTGLVAVLLLIAKKKFDSLDTAYAFLRNKRPLIKMNELQRICAEKTLEFTGKNV